MFKIKLTWFSVVIFFGFFLISCSNKTNPTSPNEEESETQVSEGYTLFNPNGSKTTYLINMENETVHTWNNSKSGGYSVYLLENGNILRPAKTSSSQLSGGASAGLVQEIDLENHYYSFYHIYLNHNSH